MVLLASTLKPGLMRLRSTDSIQDPIDIISDSFDRYFQLASVSGVVVLPGVTTPAAQAMKGPLASMNRRDRAAQAIQQAIQLYWTTLSPLIAAMWVVPGFTVVPGTLVPPPTLSAIAPALTAAWVAATRGEDSFGQAIQRMTTAIHSKQSGGTVTLQPIAPGAPVVTPIL